METKLHLIQSLEEHIEYAKPHIDLNNARDLEMYNRAQRVLLSAKAELKQEQVMALRKGGD